MKTPDLNDYISFSQINKNSFWKQHRGFCVVDINYLLPKLTYNIAFKTIQPKRFNRHAYRKMITVIVKMDLDGYTQKEIGLKVNRSSVRVAQILDKFYRRVKFIVEGEKK